MNPFVFVLPISIICCFTARWLRVQTGRTSLWHHVRNILSPGKQLLQPRSKPWRFSTNVCPSSARVFESQCRCSFSRSFHGSWALYVGYFECKHKRWRYRNSDGMWMSSGPAARKSHWQADQRVYECFRKAFKWWRPSEAVHSLMIGVCEHLSCQWNHIRPINAVSAVRDVYRCDLSPFSSLSSNCIRGRSEASIYLKDCDLLNIRQQPTRPFNKTQRCSWRLFSRAGWKI